MTWQGGAGIVPTAPIPGATAIQADAGTWGVIQLGNLEAQFGDQNIVNLASTTSRTILTIDSLYALSFLGGPTRTWLHAANVHNAFVHEISIATLPILAPTSSSLLINHNTNAILRSPGQDYEVIGGPFTSGSSYGMTGVTPKIIMVDTSYGAAYPAMTFVFPTQPYDGMEVQLTLENFSVTRPAFIGGATVLAPSSIPLGTTVRFKWNLNRSGIGAWLRTQ
jgi:predicted nuclease of predicted toxin-antitoxin system